MLFFTTKKMLVSISWDRRIGLAPYPALQKHIQAGSPVMTKSVDVKLSLEIDVAFGECNSLLSGLRREELWLVCLSCSEWTALLCE